MPHVISSFVKETRKNGINTVYSSHGTQVSELLTLPSETAPRVCLNTVYALSQIFNILIILTVAFHTTKSIALYKEVEVRSCVMAITSDFTGPEKSPGGVLTRHVWTRC